MTGRPKGFTLIELLVVAAVMAVLFGLILTGGRGRSQSALRAAQEFASLLLSTQSLALREPNGAAVIVESDGAVPRLGSLARQAAGRAPIVARVQNGTLQGHPDVGQTYKFQYRAACGKGTITVSPWLSVRNGQAGLRVVAGQTVENTILDPPSDGLEAHAARYPAPTDETLTIASPIGIDLRHSGVGDDPAAAHKHGRFEGKAPVAVVFNRTGRVAEVIQEVGRPGGPADDPIVPHGIIYFLFAERSDIDANSSLSSNKSYWVAINPQSGRINVAANEPTANGNLSVAREKARKALAKGK